MECEAPAKEDLTESETVKNNLSVDNEKTHLPQEGTPLRAAASFKPSMKVVQLYPIGTRIEKRFYGRYAGVYGGDIAAFELIELEDGKHIWAYMIHYYDGDTEHMTEDEVSAQIQRMQRRHRRNNFMHQME